MSDKTGITWTNTTWNPILGCSKVSPGCANCYAVRSVHRMAGNPNPKVSAANTNLTVRHANGKLDWNGAVRLLPERLMQPLSWKTPRRVFVNSLSDLFHPNVPDEFIRQVFKVMGEAWQHTFQVLTKRPDRMQRVVSAMAAEGDFATLHGITEPPFPWPNVWLGVSVENQATANERIPYLLKTPAAVRFLSCEPLLGPVDLGAIKQDLGDGLFGDCLNWLHRPYNGGIRRDYPTIKWVIVGGESGPGARYTENGWARSLARQCQDSGVAFFGKQAGIGLARVYNLQGKGEGPLGDCAPVALSWLDIQQYPGEEVRDAGE
ncbi:MAG: hypothetical protein JWO59_697 [Chloroflexi bacterium]|nr:hypothetical protein [Chloroflexota bacterium]